MARAGDRRRKAEEIKREKEKYVGKAVPYEALYEVINAQEKLSYLRKDCFRYAAFLLFFFLYLILAQHVTESYTMERAMRSHFTDAEFVVSTSGSVGAGKKSAVVYKTFNDISSEVRALCRASRAAPGPQTGVVFHRAWR